MTTTDRFPIKRLHLLVLLVFGLPAMSAFANPTGGDVVSGQAAIQAQGSTLTVTTATNKSIIDWQTFSIAPNEITRFVQPSTASSVLNRVLANEPSLLLGSLQSNGKVFLINPYGILVGAGAHIDVAAFVASTLNISNQDFLSDNLNFQAVLNAGKVDNQGNIRTPEGGTVYLIAPEVENGGIIQTPGGQTILAAGQTVQLMDTATPGVTVEITGADTHATNLGQIMADAGTIGMAGAMVRNSGTLDASSVVREGGRIFLKASTVDLPGTLKATGATQGGSVGVQSDVIFQTGAIEANGDSGGAISLQGNHILQAGTISVLGSGAQGGSISVVADSALIQTAFASIDASGATQGGSIALTTPNGLAFLSGTSQANGAQGGTIHVLGQDIMLATTTLDASGSNQGGTVLVGGDYQGSNPAIQNAQTVTVNPYTQINVSAETQGNGGKAVVWSDQHTIFGGNILARGGATSGDGGQVEVSGKELLGFGGAVDAGASNGNPGSLLLDPKNITIDAVSGPTYLALLDPNPAAGDSYGNGQVLELSNGNLVIASPLDDFGASNAGAVFLFDPTGGLLSTLTGSTANDNVGTSGVTQLTNGNFVVNSPLWNNGTPVSFVGAVTWGSATTGVSGPVSASNSLVGAAATDEVGSSGITALSNGNYVVSSYQWNNTGGSSGANGAGAVTWANGDGSTVGAVTASNSLVGTTTNDHVGIGGVTEVTDSTHTFDNYVVSSSSWNNGGVSGAGAVTWVDGSNGHIFGTTVTGAAVSTSNSLYGSSTNDSVGVGVTALSINGNYVVKSYEWSIPAGRISAAVAGVGAVTWADGSTGIAGAVSIDNSLVGSVTNDKVGIGGITALSNGNYVVNSYNWNNGTPLDVGAVTWADGSSGIAFGESTVGATVTASNSLVGSTQFDEVGRGGITELSNGNYVVNSPFWNNGATLSVGAVTWAKNDGSTVGAVSIGNSLYGGNANDEVGSDGITALTGNGNYVVDSSGWNNGTGAVTWGDGTNGTTGAVSTGNSLVGSVSGASGDNVGSGGITALSNGNYVVDSLEWNNGAETQAGAVTWGNGSGGTVGAVSALNSLVGSTAGDSVGGGPGDGSPIGDVEALTNGNYVVNSTFWNNGAVVDAGAVTWGNGSTAGPRLVGAVSSSNSLVGSTANDNVGSGGISALTNGNYVVISSPWDNGAVVDAGAVTWGNGSTGTVGVVSTGNSLVGSTANDNVGSGGISALTNGNYVVRSTNWNNGVATFAGAVTWVDGSNGFVFGENTTGVAVSISNSLVGSAANDSIGSRGITTLANGDYVVSSSSFNSSTGRIDLGYGNGGPDGSIGNVNDPFSTALGSDYTLTSFVLTSLLYTGTAVILQANNDITVNSAITVNNPSGNGGNLTLQAGRSILLNADITTDNGDLSLTANDNAATLADRADTSAGNISIASGVTIDTGTGAFAAAIQTLSTSGSFNNLGTLNVGGVSFITGGVSINNNGTININSGTLSIGVDGADTGDYNIASGATLAFLGGTRNIDSFSTLSGAGNITFSGGTTNLNTSVNYNVTGAITASGGTANFDATDDSSPPVNISASSLTVNGGIINFIGNDLTTPTLIFSSGTLGGNGAVNLTGPGSTWTGGNFDGTGKLVVGAGANWAVSGAASRSIFNGYDIDNLGTVNMTQSGTVFTTGTPTTFVTNTGTWNANQTAAFGEETGGGSFRFNNTSGTVNRTTAGTGTILNVTNSGTMNVQAGTLQIDNRGGFTSSGNFSVDAGSTLSFINSAHTITGGFLAGSGAGTILVPSSNTLNLSSATTIDDTISVSGGTLNVNAAVSTAGLNLSSGTLGGSGNLTAGNFDWSDGTLTSTGSLTTTGTSTLSTGSDKALNNGNWINQGTVDLNAGRLVLNGASVFTNQASGTVNVTTSDINPILGNASSSFSNAGILNWNTPGAATLGSGMGAFDNSGTVNVNSTLQVYTGGTDTGSYAVANGTTLDLSPFSGSNIRNLNAGSNITGLGALTVSGGTVNVRDSLDIAGSGTVSVSGGTLDIDTTGAEVTFANTLTLSGGILSGADNLTNQGTMTANNATIDSSFTNTGSLTLTGKSSFNGATFDFNSGSVDINSLTTLTKNGGAFNWNGGALSGPGSLSLTGGASFNIGGSGNKVLSNLTLATSDLTLASGSLDLQSGGVLNATGTTTISPNTAITVSSGTFNPSGVLDNSGTVSGATSFGSLVNSGSYSGALNGGSVTNTGTGSITTSGGTISGALDNSATLDLVSAGILTLAGGGSNSGTINLATGSNLGVSANTFSLLSGSDINGPGNFNISGGTLSADATTAIDSTLNLSSGSITGVGNLTTNGTFNWTGGSISGSGTLTTTGPSAISGTSTKTLGRQWINTDVATISGGNLTLDSGATNSGSGSMTVDTEVTVNNGNIWQNDGTITLQNASIIHLPNVGGYATFSNNGVLNIDSTAGWSFLSDSGIQGGIVNNAGTINVNHNTSWEAAFTNFSSGHLNIAAGDFLSMQNGQTIAGTVDIGASGTLWVSERHGVNAAFNSTTITGTGTLQVAAGLGPVADLTSVNAAGATLLVGAGGTVNLLDSNSVFANLTMSGGTLAGSSFMVNGGLNYTGGSLNIPLLLASGSNSTLSSVTLAGTGAITNQGTLNLANSTLSGNLDNQGALNVSAGTSSVNGTLTQSGTIDVASGATFQKSGGFTNTGTLSGFGTIDVGTGTLVNNGTVAPGASPGILTITGNYTQGPTGLLAIELGGLTPGSGYDVLNVSGIASLGGTLDVTLFGGFLPTPGNSFTVINASSVTGTFATTNLPSGYIFVTSYGPNFFGLDLPFASSLIPGTISGQPLVGIQSIAGPFYGVTVINAPPISGTTDSPVILASIQDLFIPVDSPFTAGLFGTADTGSEGGGGFGFDVGVAANSRLPVATNIPFPLFYAQVSDEEDKQPDGRVLRRPFGACSTGGGL